MSKVKFINNPFDILMEIMENDYPDVECDIHIVGSFGEDEKAYGCTIFPDDDSKPIIQILHTLSLSDATEVLAHELAHVIAGKDEEHGEVWERTFDELHAKFSKRLLEKYVEHEYEIVEEEE